MIAAIIATVPIAGAQFLPAMQAKSAEEFDAYLDALESLEAARQFLIDYPQSELRLPVYERIAESCRKKGDADCTRRAAVEGLTIAPDYIPLLTLLGSIEANTSAAPDGERADRALRLLENAKAPRTVSPAAWLAETARLRAENLATLAMVAYKTDNNTARAISLLRQSVAASPIPANQYRLAMLLAGSQRTREARALLEPLTRSADRDIAGRAAEALMNIQLR